MRIKLIPTGRCELLGLPECLRRVFPEHTFETVPARVEPDGTRVPFDGFTSTRLPSSFVPGNLLKLVQQLASEVHPGRDGQPADLAVLLDDLELENADQAEVVTGAVRDAVRQHLEALSLRENAARVQRVKDALRERASFHLAAPMIEAWFFAAQTALSAAGVPADRLPPRLRMDSDPEAFETDDAAFSQDDGAACEAMRAENAHRRKPVRPPWVLPPRPELPDYRRERHPKAYLAWLCRDPQDRRCCSTYRESHGGAAALRDLDLRQVLRTREHARFVRSFLRDLADALGSPAVDFLEGEEHPLVSRSMARRDRVLRNL